MFSEVECKKLLAKGLCWDALSFGKGKGSFWFELEAGCTALFRVQVLKQAPQDLMTSLPGIMQPVRHRHGKYVTCRRRVMRAKPSGLAKLKGCLCSKLF